MKPILYIALAVAGMIAGCGRVDADDVDAGSLALSDSGTTDTRPIDGGYNPGEKAVTLFWNAIVGGTVTNCTETYVIPPADWDSIKSQYSACNVADLGNLGAAINCENTCSVTGAAPICAAVPGASTTSCAWSPI